MSKTNQNKAIERRLTALETLMQDTREDMRDLKDNHLKKIYEKLDAFQISLTDLQIDILRKMAQKPSWTVALTITILTSLTTALIILLLKGS